MKKSLLILMVCVFACQSGKENEINALKDEVMAVHDEVMPKMSELTYTKNDLLKMVDSLKDVDSTKAVILYEAAQNINAANDAMRSWMQNYEVNFEGTDDEILDYLNAQKEVIQKVNNDMKSSLAKGKELLDKE